MLDWMKVAEEMYDAYGATTDYKNFRGDPMPAFGDLPEAIRNAWEAAARRADEVLQELRG
jgi:hypothetical protein